MVGIGVDLVDIARFGAALTRHRGHLEDRLFTDAERGACSGRSDRVAALAARFAAKEACLKALGTGWSRGLAFRQVEVEGGSGSPPRLRLHGAAAERARALGVGRIFVSLTHDGPAAMAMVILDSADAGGGLRPGPGGRGSPPPASS